MKRILAKTLLSLSILVTASAYAANGYVTENVYLRAGPDAGYPSVAMLGAGSPVAIEGCVNGWSWCEVDAGGNHGWVKGDFLQDDYRGQRVLVPQYGVQIGIPIIGFVFATYWQDHYRNRPWYSQRARWSQVRPRYQTVVVRDHSYDNPHASGHGNSRGTHGVSPVSHTTDQRTRGESHRTTFVTAPARSVHETRPVRAATPQYRTTQPRIAVAQHKAAVRPKAQPKKQPAKSKSDKNKHPDSSGQH